MTCLVGKFTRKLGLLVLEDAQTALGSRQFQAETQLGLARFVAVRSDLRNPPERGGARFAGRESSNRVVAQRTRSGQVLAEIGFCFKL